MSIEKEREETKALKNDIKELYEECDLLSDEEKDQFDALFSRALNLGKMRERLKLEGCVVVPVKPTYKQLDALKNSCELFKKAGVSDLEAHGAYKAMLEAARGGNE